MITYPTVLGVPSNQTAMCDVGRGVLDSDLAIDNEDLVDPRKIDDQTHCKIGMDLSS